MEENKTILKDFKDGLGRFYKTVQISDNITKEEDTGYLICKNAIFGHTGIQKYYGREIGLKDEKANEIIEMIRDESEVFNGESMSSFKGKPVTLYHPDVKVNSANFNKYIVGSINDVDRVENNLTGDITIYDEYTIDKILKGELKDLSLGYKAKVVPLADGRYKQENILINHLAIVEQGRAKNAQIIDENTVLADGEKVAVLEPKDFTDKVYVTKTNENSKTTRTYDDDTGEETFKKETVYESKNCAYDTYKQQMIDNAIENKNKNKGEKKIMEKDFKYFMTELKDLSSFPKSDFRDKAYEALFNDCKETLGVDLPTIEDTKANVITKSVGLTDNQINITDDDKETKPKALSMFAKDEDRFFSKLYRSMDDAEVAKKYANMTYNDVYDAVVEGRKL